MTGQFRRKTRLRKDLEGTSEKRRDDVGSVGNDVLRCEVRLTRMWYTEVPHTIESKETILV